MQYYNNSPLDTHVCIFILTCYYFTDSYKNIRTDRDNLRYCDHHAYNIFFTSLTSLHQTGPFPSDEVYFFRSFSAPLWDIWRKRLWSLHIWDTDHRKRRCEFSSFAEGNSSKEQDFLLPRIVPQDPEFWYYRIQARSMRDTSSNQ